MVESPNLSVKLAGIKMKNPVMVASGTFGFGEEYSQVVDLNRLGALVVKSITLKPRKGNPPPRIAETASGMLNSIGLENEGIEDFMENKLPFLSQFSIPLIVNIAGEKVQEYGELAKILNEAEEVSGIEVNISCPNVPAGGMIFGQNPRLTQEVIETVKENTHKTLIAKLTPNVTDIVEIAKAALEAGADVVSLINTVLGMAIDIKTRRPKLGNITGGLSGPAIKPIALRCVYQVARAVQAPIIGIGGIMNAQDALEFIIAGATAIAVGTANFVNPRATIEIMEGIREYLIGNNIKDIKELIGSLQTRHKKDEQFIER